MIVTVQSCRRFSLRRIADRLDLWAERHRQRRALLELDQRMLEDLGLTPAEVWIEASKPFWR